MWRFVAKSQNRRNRLGGVRVEAAAWLTILERFGYCCAYCGHPSSEVGTLAQEHVIPISRGGRHAVENIVPACKSCNSSKGAKLPEEWVVRLERTRDDRTPGGELT